MEKQENKNLDSFVFYRSWYDTFRDFDSPEEQVKFIDCILSYALNGEIIHKENKSVQRSANLIYPLIDKSQIKRAKNINNATKGGRSKSISEEQIEQACNLRELGFTWKQISEALEIPERTLYRYSLETATTANTDKTEQTDNVSNVANNENISIESGADEVICKKNDENILPQLPQLPDPLCIMSYGNMINVNDNGNMNNVNDIMDDVNANENDDVDVYTETPTTSNIMPIGNPIKDKEYITDIVDFISIISKSDDTKHIKNSLTKKINSENLSAETFFNELKDNHSYLSEYCENSANKKDNVYYIINVTAKRIMNSKTNIKTTKPIEPKDKFILWVKEKYNIDLNYKSETTDYLNMKNKEGIHCEDWLSIINSKDFTFTGNVFNDLKSALENSCKHNNQQLEETYKKVVYDLRYFKEVFELYNMNYIDIYNISSNFSRLLDKIQVSNFEYTDLVNLWLNRIDNNKNKSYFIQDADTVIASFINKKYNPPVNQINETVKTLNTEYDPDDIPF